MCAIREIDAKFIDEKINSKLGQKKTEIISDPSKHYDFSIIQISDEKLIGMATDNAIFLNALSPDRSAYLTFHRSADLLASSGIIPEYFSVSLHFPENLDEETVSHFWNSLNIESKKFQASITGSKAVVGINVFQPFIGGTTSMGTSRPSFVVDPGRALDGDRILMTKTAGLEAATVLSSIMSEKVEEKIGQYGQKLAQKLFFKTSTLQESQEAVKFGLGRNGITSMKNVRDSGILGALEEYSRAGSFGAEIDFESIPVYDEVREICNLFSLDPYRTGSMGSLLLTIPQEFVEDFTKALVGNGIDVSDIGRVDRSSNVVRFKGYREVDGELIGERSFYNSIPLSNGAVD